MPRRRELLKAGAVAIAVGTAGCNRSGTDGGAREDDDPGDDSSGNDGSVTPGDDEDEDHSAGNDDGSSGDDSEESERIEGWPSFQRTPRNDGHAAGLSLSSDPTERFRVALPAGIEYQPVVVGDLLYAHLADGTLCARDAATGEEVWTEPLEAQGRTPCVVDGEVVAGTEAGIEGFDRATGESAWQVEVAGMSTAPTPADGLVYAGTDDGTVVVVDPTEPAITERIEVGGSVATAPAVVDGALFVETEDRERGSKLVAVHDSEVDWRGDVFGPEAVVATSNRVIGVNRGGFTLYTHAGGRRGGGTASTVPPVDDRAIYTGSEVVTPLSRRNSGTDWTFWPEDPDRFAEVVAPMSVCVDTLCVPWGYEDGEDWRRRLLGLDVETGEKRWERSLPDSEPTGVVLADGAAFVGTVDGELLAFE